MKKMKMCKTSRRNLELLLSGDLAKQTLKFLEETKRECFEPHKDFFLVDLWIKKNIKVYRKTKSKQPRYVRVVKK